MLKSKEVHLALKKEIQTVVVLDEQGCVLDANENGNLIFGTKGILAGKHLADFIVNKTQEDMISWLKLVRMGSINVMLVKLIDNEECEFEMSMQGTYSSMSNSYICFLSELELLKVDSEDENDVGLDAAEDLSEFVNKDLFQSLMDEFYELTGIPIGVIDMSGNVLVAEGWQDICTKFHRIHPETCANCVASDVELTHGIQMGEFREYKCKNNMWDVATPIYIGDKRKGHIYLGQFFYDDEIVDREFFRKQAHRYGFDEKDYLEALERVPRFSHETIRLAMSFYAKLAALIAELSYTNAKLVEAHNNLERLVDERTLKLMTSNKELVIVNDELKDTLIELKETQNQLIMSEKMAALGSLVAGISHEISTPLGISVTSVSYIEHELDEVGRKYNESTMKKQDFEDFLKDSKSMMKTTVKSLQRADQLLNSFKMIAVDQTNNEWRSFNGSQYTRELLYSLESILKSKNCKIEFVCPENFEIKGYPGVFAQIITNLINNSVVHAFNEHQGTIRIVLKKKKGKNYLYYSDDGIGMTEEVQRRAFEPFFTTKRGAEGCTGLGLHLVYNLVTQKLGGSILMNTKVGEGTRFEIVFPDFVPEQFRS